jgi:hypothetical protein
MIGLFAAKQVISLKKFNLGKDILNSILWASLTLSIMTVLNHNHGFFSELDQISKTIYDFLPTIWN